MSGHTAHAHASNNTHYGDKHKYHGTNAIQRLAWYTEYYSIVKFSPFAPPPWVSVRRGGWLGCGTTMSGFCGDRPSGEISCATPCRRYSPVLNTIMLTAPMMALCYHLRTCISVLLREEKLIGDHMVCGLCLLFSFQGDDHYLSSARAQSHTANTRNQAQCDAHAPWPASSPCSLDGML